MKHLKYLNFKGSDGQDSRSFWTFLAFELAFVKATLLFVGAKGVKVLYPPSTTLSFHLKKGTQSVPTVITEQEYKAVLPNLEILTT